MKLQNPNRALKAYAEALFKAQAWEVSQDPLGFSDKNEYYDLVDKYQRAEALLEKAGYEIVATTKQAEYFGQVFTHVTSVKLRKNSKQA